MSYGSHYVNSTYYHFNAWHEIIDRRAVWRMALLRKWPQVQFVIRYYRHLSSVFMHSGGKNGIANDWQHTSDDHRDDYTLQHPPYNALKNLKLTQIKNTPNTKKFWDVAQRLHQEYSWNTETGRLFALIRLVVIRPSDTSLNKITPQNGNTAPAHIQTPLFNIHLNSWHYKTYEVTRSQTLPLTVNYKGKILFLIARDTNPRS